MLNAENDLTLARNCQLEAVESFAYAVTLKWRSIGVLLDRLRKAYANGFILGSKKEGYNVYAGSYFNAHGADQERKRLAALGITVTPVETSVPVPTFLLTVGSFPGQEAAREALAKLKQSGLVAELVEAGGR